jgi:hypothetical protein
MQKATIKNSISVQKRGNPTRSSTQANRLGKSRIHAENYAMKIDQSPVNNASVTQSNYYKQP